MASAATHRGFTASFGSEGSGAGQLSEPAGVAVSESSGDVYVADKGNLRVDVFSSSGAFVRAWGWGVADGVSNEFQTCTLACFKGIAGSGAGQFSAPEAIAVDNSGSVSDPSNGDVYVGDRTNNVIQKFGPEGSYLGQITNGSGGAPLTGVLGVAVDSNGALWVYEGVQNTEGTGEVIGYSAALVNALESQCKSQAEGNVEPGFAIDAEGAFYVGHRIAQKFAKLKSNCELDEGLEEVGGEHSTAIAVDLTSNEVYVNSGSEVKVFSPTAAPIETFGEKHPVSGIGIAVNPASEAVYVSDRAANTVDVFTPGQTPEAPVTSAASGVGTTEATLHGELNPGGAAGALEYQFDYNKGASCSGGQSTPIAEVPEAKEAPVQADVTGLQPSAEYTFCLVALNTFGPSEGNELQFTTAAVPPVVESESAPAPRSSEATLSAQINANNQETTYSFEYSTQATGDTLEGSITSLPGASPLPAEFGAQEARVETGAALTPTTLYFYRVVAVNASKEEATGKVEHFTTGPPEQPQASKPEPLTATTAVLKGVLNPKQPGNPGSYEFFYRQSNSECQGEGQKTTPPSPTTGAQAEPAEAEITELLPNATYTFCLQASDEAGETSLSSPVTFTTLPLKPALTSETASNLTASTVDLTAKVNPGGLPTSYRFEYGTSTAYGTRAPEPDGTTSSGTNPVSVTVHLTSLEHDTLYHWRVVASNGAGTTTGVDHTFIYPTSGGGLPDGRAYEMVTPAAKNGALLGNVIAGLLPTWSPDGSRLILSSVQCFADARSCPAERSTVGSSYAFSRTSGNWVASAMAPSSAQFEVNTVMAVNASDGSALYSIPTPPHGQDDVYAQQLDGTLTDIGPVTPPELGPQGPPGALVLATSDFSRVVIEGGKSGWPFDETTGTSSVIEYLGSGSSHPVMVGVRGGAGSSELVSLCATNLGAGQSAATASALSGDGRTVFFTAVRCNAVGQRAAVPAYEVWARLDESESVELSKSECDAGEAGEAACRGAETEPADAVFQGAPVNGARAFFTSTQQLTDNANEDNSAGDSASASDGSGCVRTTGTNGCNLYEYNMGDRRLRAVSAGAVSGGPRVQGVMAIAGDGSHVYFVARGVLSTVANARGVAAEDGGANLYVLERDSAHPDGLVKFIATLSDANRAESASDEQEWNSPGGGAANVSSDGRFFVFTSQAPLTGDDTRRDGAPAQVFRYDDVTGELVRVSVGDGGFNDDGNAGVGDATIVRGSALTSSPGESGRSDPTMSDDGRRVFFMSPNALVPGALDDVVLAGESGRTEYAKNIYEFEEGRVSLISSGRDVNVLPNPTCESVSATCLIGSDVTGDNVFFTTTDRLAPGDSDTQLDFYDARVCSAFSPCVGAAPQQPPGCSGEVCHGTPAATRGAPGVASSTLSGLGNVAPGPPPRPTPKTVSRAQKFSKALKACRRSHRRSKRRRLVCERAARKRYGGKKTLRKAAGKAVRADVGLGGSASGGVR